MHSCASSVPSFCKCEKGVVAPLFGLVILVIMILSGVAVDASRASRISTQSAAALDAAALATAKALRLAKPSDEELEAIAQRYFAANFQGIASGDAQIKSFVTQSVRETNTVSLLLDLEVPTTFAAIMGKKCMDVATRATAVFDAKDVEVSMMLDVSGSMKGSRIAELKLAAKDLVDILLTDGDGSSSNRIVIAPFDTAVNAGSLSGSIAGQGNGGGNSQADKGTTCVTERPGANAFKDKGPTGGLLGKKSSACPSSEVVPLTNDLDELTKAIDSMQAVGMTAGHVGVAWAWYLISPEWSSVFPESSAPRAYNDPEVRKVAILMTDGEFNKSYESANGNSQVQAQKICDNMKTSGITIYTVGFQAPAGALAILQYCATTPTHFFDAKNGNQLRETFQKIAKELNGLRISS
jgi:Flp pilus assembly protein TadG